MFRHVLAGLDGNAGRLVSVPTARMSLPSARHLGARRPPFVPEVDSSPRHRLTPRRWWGRFSLCAWPTSIPRRRRGLGRGPEGTGRGRLRKGAPTGIAGRGSSGEAAYVTSTSKVGWPTPSRLPVKRPRFGLFFPEKK